MADIDKVQAAPVAKGKKGKKKGIQMSWQAFVGTANSNAPVIQPASTNSANSTCWADEMEDVNTDGDESSEYKINREALPTAPKSVLKAAFDESEVPTNPPFTAFVSNLPFDVNHDEIHKFFKNLNIKEIRLQKDSMGRARGFGHIDFETREMLIGAMSCNELYIKNRPVKVSLQQAVANDYGGRKERESEDDKTMSSNWRRKEASDGKKDDFDRDGDRGYRGGGGGGGGGERYGRQKEGAADTQDKWKASGTGSSDSNRYSNQRDRYDRDSQDRGNNRDRYNDRNDRSYNNRGNNDQNSGRYSDRGNDRYNDNRSDNRSDNRYNDRGNDNRYNDRGNDNRYNDRGNDRNDNRYNDRGNDRNDNRYNDRGNDNRYNDRNNDRSDRPNNDQMDREWRRKDTKEESKGGDSNDRQEDKPRHVEPRNDTQAQSTPSVHSPPPPPPAAAVSETPKERTKLNLKPRTKPIEKDTPVGSTTKQSSIFGGAKPVDTSAKEREVEERLKQKMLEAKKPRERVSSTTTSDPKSLNNSERRGSTDSLHSNNGISDGASDHDKILPAPPPKVNAWAARRSQQKPRSSPQQSQSDTTATSHNHRHTNSSDRAGSHPDDRHNTNAANTSHSTSSISNKRGDAWVARGSSGGGGRGGGGRGGNTTGSGVGRGAARTKTTPQTIDGMPKAETKTAKDWSNANKFDTLLTTDQQNDERDNNDERDDDDNEAVKLTLTPQNKESLSPHQDTKDDEEEDDDNSWSQVTYSKATHERLEQ